MGGNVGNNLILWRKCFKGPKPLCVTAELVLRQQGWVGCFVNGPSHGSILPLTFIWVHFLGEAMLLISRFCSSDKFVILDLPCPGSCFGVSWARSSDMGTIAIEITYRCVYNIHRHLYMFKRLYTSDSLDIYNIYIYILHWFKKLFIWSWVEEPGDVVGLIMSKLIIVLTRSTRPWWWQSSSCDGMGSEYLKYT